MDGVAHPPFIIAAVEHTGHRRDTQLFDILVGVQVVFHVRITWYPGQWMVNL